MVSPRCPTNPGPADFLASPAAAYTTGQGRIVDGGWTVW